MDKNLYVEFEGSLHQMVYSSIVYFLKNMNELDFIIVCDNKQKLITLAIEIYNTVMGKKFEGNEFFELIESEGAKLITQEHLLMEDDNAITPLVTPLDTFKSTTMFHILTPCPTIVLIAPINTISRK